MSRDERSAERNDRMVAVSGGKFRQATVWRSTNKNGQCAGTGRLK
jgi:hypothetical protein